MKVTKFKEALQMSDTSTKSPDIENIFDAIIRDGYKAKEREVLPGFKVKLRPLSYNELSRAEAEISRHNPDVPQDITVKLRCAKILSAAIIAINGNLIDMPDQPETNEARRVYLYDRLVRMPTVHVQEAYQLYLEAVAEEADFYRKGSKLNAEDTANF